MGIWDSPDRDSALSETSREVLHAVADATHAHPLTPGSLDVAVGIAGMVLARAAVDPRTPDSLAAILAFVPLYAATYETLQAERAAHEATRELLLQYTTPPEVLL